VAHPTSASGEAIVERRRTQVPGVPLVLLAGWLLCFVLLPFRVGTIYSGLPAHPLFLHVPVILIPIVAVATLVYVVLPRWAAPYGEALAATAVVTLAGTVLTVDAGFGMRARMVHQFQGIPLPPALRPNGLVSRHAHYARILELLMFVFTFALLVLVVVAARRASRPRGVDAGLRVAAAGLALACLFFVVRAGDLGAKAVWRTPNGPGIVTLPGGLPPPTAQTTTTP
jgi:hypothetical protein